MRARFLTLFLAGVAGALFAIPLPAQAGPTTCPSSGAICIDESVEGSFPSITFGGVPAGTVVTISLRQPAVGEEWAFTISVPFTDFPVSVSSASLGLLEPGSQAVSDAITNNTVNIDNSTHTLIMSFDLFSDNDLGQIGIGGSFVNLLTEDGTFQQVPGTFFTTTQGTINVYLKSDVEPVPEPASLVLFGTALVAFGVMRRRRRNHEFTA